MAPGAPTTGILFDLIENREVHRVEVDRRQSFVDLSPDGCYALTVDGTWQTRLFKLTAPGAAESSRPSQ